MTTRTVKDVSINHGTEVMSDERLDSAANTVNMAVSTLIAAHSRLKQKNLNFREKQYCKQYLKTDDKGLTDAERWGLMAIFSNTLNGLNANRRINVKQMKGAYGSVAYRLIKPDQAISMRKAGKTVARHAEHNSLIARDDINIAINTLDKNVILRVQTLIHEASHRYANTRDFGNKGYTNADGSYFIEEGLTRKQAIFNADSVAWVAVKMAKPFCSWLDPVQCTLRDAMKARRAGMGY